MSKRWLISLCGFALIAVSFNGADPKSAALAANKKVASSKNFDWPQWQGQARTGISKETGLLKEWSKEGPPLAWKIKGCGEGYSTPSVAQGRIFTMGNRDGNEYVFAFAEKNGDKLWEAEVGKVRHNGGRYHGPRCTPTVDGDVIYALGLNGDLLCLEAATGKERWRKDLRQDYKGSPGGWGYCESPLVDGNKLIVTPGGGTATLVALNKKDGETIWQSQVRGGDAAAYSSVIAAEVDGKKEYIQFLHGGVVGIQADDGKFLWRYNKPANGTANCSTPVYHDLHVFAASGYGTGGGLAKLTPNGDEVKAEEVFFTRNMKNQHGGMVLIDGYLYGSNEGQLTCLEYNTGKVMWENNKPGKGSIAAADGMLYYRNEGGPIVLVEANPKEYIEHGRFNQTDRSGASAWPHPVLANGKLYIRDQDTLLCYDVKEK